MNLNIVSGAFVELSEMHGNIRRLVQLHKLARHVSTENLKLGTLLCSLPDFGRSSRECGDPLRVGKRLKQLLGSRSELLLIRQTCNVDIRLGVR